MQQVHHPASSVQSLKPVQLEPSRAGFSDASIPSFEEGTAVEPSPRRYFSAQPVIGGELVKRETRPGSPARKHAHSDSMRDLKDGSESVDGNASVVGPDKIAFAFHDKDELQQVIIEPLERK